MGLLNLCEEYFGSSNLYEVLDIEKTAKDKEVKKAYYKLSMKVHPDRVQEEEKLLATEKFKVLSQIHNILTDTKKKELYDQTGNVDDDSEASIDSWMDYWRQLFKRITTEDIQNYEQKYKGSEEELQDLKRAYIRGRGCLNFIQDSVPFLTIDDEPRIIETMKGLIEKNEVPEFKIFTKEPEAKRRRRHNKYKKEAQHVERIQQKENRGNSSTDLVALIQKRNADRGENFLDALANKYAAKVKNKSKKTKSPKRLSQTSKKGTPK